MSTVIEFDFKENTIGNGTGNKYPTDTVSPLLLKNNFGIFPRGVRSINFHENGSASIVFEESPRKRLVRYKYNDRGQYELFEIETPWVVYIVELNTLTMGATHVFFRPSSIVSKEDMLYWAPLPNLYNMEPGLQGGRICPASTQMVKVVADKGIASFYKTMNRVVESFWSSNFNDDLQAYMRTRPFSNFSERVNPVHKGHEGFTVWEKLSADQVATLAWHPAFPLSRFTDDITELEARALNGATLRQEIHRLFEDPLLNIPAAGGDVFRGRGRDHEEEDDDDREEDTADEEDDI